MEGMLSRRETYQTMTSLRALAWKRTAGWFELANSTATARGVPEEESNTIFVTRERVTTLRLGLARTSGVR